MPEVSHGRDHWSRNDGCLGGWIARSMAGESESEEEENEDFPLFEQYCHGKPNSGTQPQVDCLKRSSADSWIRQERGRVPLEQNPLEAVTADGLCVRSWAAVGFRRSPSSVMTTALTSAMPARHTSVPNITSFQNRPQRPGPVFITAARRAIALTAESVNCKSTPSISKQGLILSHQCIAGAQSRLE